MSGNYGLQPRTVLEEQRVKSGHGSTPIITVNKAETIRVSADQSALISV